MVVLASPEGNVNSWLPDQSLMAISLNYFLLHTYKQLWLYPDLFCGSMSQTVLLNGKSMGY